MIIGVNQKNVERPIVSKSVILCLKRFEMGSKSLSGALEKSDSDRIGNGLGSVEFFFRIGAETDSDPFVIRLGSFNEWMLRFN